MSLLTDISWESFQKLTLCEKAPYFRSNGHEGHVIIAQQFDRERLDALGNLATRIRRIAKSHEGLDFLQSLLSHRRAMLYFSQPSTRTFLSFLAACEILGLKTGEVRDASTSSEFKGESQEDSVRTFSSYFDLIVMRSKIGGLAERMAWLLSNSERPVPILNAGSGKDQHPTQAVLDIYTLQRSFEKSGGIDGKRVVFVGDLLRGRTVRSLSFLLTQYRDVEQVFVAPPQLQVAEDIQAMLTSAGVQFSLTDDFQSQIPDADAIYMTRVQDEWDTQQGESEKADISKFCLGMDELALMKPASVIMHPLPRREEIAVEVDHDPRAVYWRQMRNGMWVRAAMIATIFEKHKRIEAYANEHAV
ncbi:MAG: aspartate carbamoyltransferase [Verrucomicrobia bacterium]|jgi:aspartate carbamoyltransferase catalytic subunit|nr:aspartate carbamoyltransferase [Verrucomicrobiota bacterium]